MGFLNDIDGLTRISFNNDLEKKLLRLWIDRLVDIAFISKKYSIREEYYHDYIDLYVTQEHSIGSHYDTLYYQDMSFRKFIRKACLSDIIPRSS